MGIWKTMGISALVAAGVATAVKAVYYFKDKRTAQGNEDLARRVNAQTSSAHMKGLVEGETMNPDAGPPPGYASYKDLVSANSGRGSGTPDL